MNLLIVSSCLFMSCSRLRYGIQDFSTSVQYFCCSVNLKHVVFLGYPCCWQDLTLPSARVRNQSLSRTKVSLELSKVQQQDLPSHGQTACQESPDVTPTAVHCLMRKGIKRQRKSEVFSNVMSLHRVSRRSGLLEQ